MLDMHANEGGRKIIMKRIARRLSLLLVLTMVIAMIPAAPSFAAAKKPATPKISKVVVDQNTAKVTVTFKKAKNAKSYKLYSRTTKASWKFVKKIKTSQKKKYSNANKYKLVKSGKKFKVYKKTTTYTYKHLATSKKTSMAFTGSWNTSYDLVVRAYNGKNASKYSAVKKALIGANPAESKPAPAPQKKDIDTYVFFGSDSRAADETWKKAGVDNSVDWTVNHAGGTEGTPRSDVIMLFNVNKDDNTIDIVSIYRDTALNIALSGEPNIQNINRAYADYGPEGACKVLEMNLDIKIKGYAVATFKGVADVIDELEGVTINVEPIETYDEVQKTRELYDVVQVANAYIDEMNAVYNVDTPHIKGSGEQTLTGLQAVAYARVRYTGPIGANDDAADTGSDRTRTVRQKRVLEQMIEKYKKLPDSEKVSLLFAHRDGVEIHFLFGDNSNPFNRMKSLIDEAKDYKPIKSGFPYKWLAKNKYSPDEKDGQIVMVVPDTLVDNVAKYHNSVYLDNGYTASEAVKKNSIAIEKAEYIK